VHFGNETFLNALANGYKKWIFRRSLRSTALLLSQTPVAECRIKQTYGYSGKTTQLPNAISLDSLRGDQLSARPMALEGREHRLRLFCLTRYYPHKNLESIVDMFVRFGEELQDVLVVLTISADDHPNARKLLRTIDRRDLRANILNVGPLAQEELSAYYRHCHALFLPTLLESFTSTYLEAMQFGAPILTSDLDFARFICGEAAVYFNPWSLCEMKEMVVKFRDNPGLASLVAAKGKARIGHISPTWEDLARRACQAMQAIVAGQGASSDPSCCPVAKGYA
jgi:glycosyltransferase involved in cell wall biosynthesis